MKAALLLALVLSACGGGGGAPAPTVKPAEPVTPKYTYNVLVQPEDKVLLDEPGFNLSIVPTQETDPIKSVAFQRQQPGGIILTVGFTRQAGFVGLDLYLTEAQRDARMRHVYLYDEMFWTGSDIEVGRDEDAINSASYKARAKGFKTVVSILPDVILRSDFKLKDINALDVLAIDVYPTARASKSVPTCRTGPNYLTNLLACSTEKLRAMGYTGEVWYLAQAFGDDRVSPAELREALTLQRETITAAPSFGITGFVPFGLHFGLAEMRREPALYPLAGTPLEPLVRYLPKGV